MIQLPNRGTATNGHEKYLVPREREYQEKIFLRTSTGGERSNARRSPPRRRRGGLFEVSAADKPPVDMGATPLGTKRPPPSPSAIKTKSSCGVQMDEDAHSDFQNHIERVTPARAHGASSPPTIIGRRQGEQQKLPKVMRPTVALYRKPSASVG